MPEKPDRRRYTRVEFDGDAFLEQADIHLPVTVVDLSLNGVLIRTPNQYSISAEHPVDLRIDLSDDVKIRMKAMLVHSSDRVLGFQCDTIDLESVAHLRRLIELNIDDPMAPERVLSELLEAV